MVARSVQIFISNHFSPNEALLHVAVHCSGRFLRRQMPGDGPGSHFVLANRKKRSQIEQGKGTTDDTIQGALGEPKILSEGGGLRFRKLSHLHFQLSPYDHRFHIIGSDIREAVVFISIVHDYQHRFGGKEGEPAKIWCRCQFGIHPQRFFGIENFKTGLQQFLFRTADLFPLLLFGGKPFQTFFDGPEISDEEFILQFSEIPPDIGLAQGRLRKIPDHHQKGVHRAHVREEERHIFLLAVHNPWKTLKIQVGHLGMGGFFGVVEAAQPFQPGIGDGNYAQDRHRMSPGGDGLAGSPGEGIKNGGLTRSGQTNNSEFHRWLLQRRK